MFENKYPYTDFSELNLDWFLSEFKKVLTEQATLTGKVQTLEETVTQFTDFVTNYFDDLDVQQEINVKLNAMAADGTLSTLLSPFVTSDVTAWLNANVDPVGSAVVVDSSLSISGAAADAKVVGDTLAKQSGVYPDMIVGAADNLISTQKITDRVPYNIRMTDDGFDVGNTKNVKSIIGGCVVWNQLVHGTSESISLISNHKYLILADLEGAVWAVVSGIGSVLTLKKAFDLSVMFGTDVADYVYTMDQGNAGSGAVWFAKLFPRFESAAFNAGEIINVKTTGSKSTGFNLYNPSTSMLKLVGGEDYQITGNYTMLTYSPVVGSIYLITPDAAGYFTVSVNGTLTVTGGDADTTCIHLVRSGARDNQYEAYHSNTYVIDDVDLLGAPQLSAANKLYYDGDTYWPYGSIDKKYEIIDLGSLSWTYLSVGRFYATIPNFKFPPDFLTKFNGVCEKYVVTPFTNTIYTDKNIYAAYTTQLVYIKDTDYSDAAAFTAALSGCYLVFELDTPSTASADPYDNMQIVDSWGIEEFIDTRSIPVPVGHDTDYDKDLKAKLEMIPDPPAADGIYKLRCTVSGGQPVIVWQSDT